MSLRKISDDFIDQNSRTNVVDHPVSVLDQVYSWTGRDIRLSHLILQLILRLGFQIPSGQEESRVAELVQDKVIKNWEMQEAAEFLKEKRDRILDHPKKIKILLKLYRLLSSESVKSDTSVEAQILMESELVVTDQGMLKIHNPIYAAIFNRAWVEQELESSNLKSYSSRNASVPSQGSWIEKIRLPAKKYSPAIFSLLFVAGMFWFLPPQVDKIESSRVGSPSPVQPPQLEPIPPTSLSSGDKNLIDEERSTENIRPLTADRFLTAKNLGINEFQQGNYENARRRFREVLGVYGNAPETRIYLNNADIKAQGKRSYTIAAVVPITREKGAAQQMLRGGEHVSFAMSTRDKAR